MGTTHLDLVKPTIDEYVDLADHFNNNWQKIDDYIGGAKGSKASIDARLDISLNEDGTLKVAGIPSGVICMWHGTIANIPAGWYLCNGSNDTPNLLDRFILSVGESQDPGGTGGSNTHIHAKGSLGADSGGSHGHSITGTTAAGSSHTHAGGSLSPHRGITSRLSTNGNVGNDRLEVITGGSNQRLVLYAWYGVSGAESSHTHGVGSLAASSGGSHTHTISGTTAAGDNVPVYYKLAFIMKS